MQIITSINAKGGCGKSTIAMNIASGLAMRGHDTLFIDMDPQAQVTQWLGAGDGLRVTGTLASAMAGNEPFDQVIQTTPFEHLWFIASSEGLEELGRQITDREDYATILTRLLSTSTRQFEFVVIDSPNQISPIMENAIFPSDLFLVPFESTKAVRSYANFFKLLMHLRAGKEHRLLHVMSNLSRQPGLRNKVIAAMQLHGIPMANTEIRTCGWLAQADEHGGSIYHYRPYSKGAADMEALTTEVLIKLGVGTKGVEATGVQNGDIEAAGIETAGVKTTTVDHGVSDAEVPAAANAVSSEEPPAVTQVESDPDALTAVPEPQMNHYFTI